MEIDTQALTTCEVAADGGAVSLGFVDAGGKPAVIRLSLNQLGALAMTLPGLIDKALQARFGDRSLRYAYPLEFLEARAILRPLPGHGHAADRRRLQRLLLDPARPAKRTRRGAGVAAGAGNGDPAALNRLASSWRSREAN